MLILYTYPYTYREYKMSFSSLCNIYTDILNYSEKKEGMETSDKLGSFKMANVYNWFRISEIRRLMSM